MNALFNFHATFPVDVDDEGVDSKYVGIMKQLCKKYAIQFERGANGNFHYQAQFSLKVKTRSLTLANGIRKKFGVHVHVSPTHDELVDYSMKQDTRIRGPWTDADVPPVWQNPDLENFEIQPWMDVVIDSKDVREFRKIHFVYDPNGNIGKSVCIQIAVQRHGFFPLPCLGTYKDASQFFYAYHKNRGFPRDIAPIMADIPRNLTQSKISEFYAGLESLKGGFAFDSRYGGDFFYFRAPQIWVFGNTLPNPNWLSGDRWEWHRVVGGELNTCTFEEIAGDIPIHRPEAKRKRE